jgi:hypothetical protein
MTYRFTGLPAGVYQVERRFAEIENKRPGQRQFDVIVNGSPYLIALDISGWWRGTTRWTGRSS